ncbi:MAG: thioredoxin family protein, partial [Ilumatobacteraceae bacterium]
MSDESSVRPLPDGIVVVVKRECETCKMIVPVLRELQAATRLTVFTQDDATFPDDPAAVFDGDLAVSWHHDVETVPTVIRVVDGAEVDRTVGWYRPEWERVSGVDDLGAGLPEMRPGCGSLSVDPDLVDELRVRFGASVLASRRVDVADAEDEMEMMFDRGWTDGLPVVPPTEERVMRMLTGTTRAPLDIVATVPPDLVEVTVEKVAIAAVMAGCKPEYLPWVLTAVEAACTDEFNIHGILATTMPVGPVMVCSGPGTRAIGMNSGGNVLGQGNRANSTIGRALQLVIRNVGGGRPGEVDRAAHGNPGKIGFCFAENDLESPYGTIAAERGIDPGVDALTLFPGEGPRCVVDQISREPDSLARSLAACLQSLHHPKLVLGFDAILVMGPEHARVFADAGWGREEILAGIGAHLNRPGSELVRGADGMAEGLPEAFADAPAMPKFREGG